MGWPRPFRLASSAGAALLAAAVMLAPAAMEAQASGNGLKPGAPSWCRSCSAPTDPPWIPPVEPVPGDPGNPGDGGSSNGRRGWAAIGAAGLALAAGIPLGSALQPTLPFRPVVAETAPALPQASQVAVEAPGVLPSTVPLPVQEAAGILAPNTASHLPLLLAIGIAAIAGGIALLRDHRRRKRRSRTPRALV